MGNPNNRTCLRRHNTAPPRRTVQYYSNRRASSFAVRNHHRLNKLNPYIGCFRHSPPTTSLKISSGSTTFCSASLLKKNSSPHLGWFRHAPPSQSNYHGSKMQKERKEYPWFSDIEKEGLMTLLLNTKLPLKSKNTLVDMYISGHLKGGGKEKKNASGITTRNSATELLKSPAIRCVQQTLQESSTESTSATVKVLARLASWFLFPVAHDAESCGYPRGNDCDYSDEYPLFFNLKHLDTVPTLKENSNGRHEDDEDKRDRNEDDAVTSYDDYSSASEDGDNDDSYYSNSSYSSSLESRGTNPDKQHQQLQQQQQPQQPQQQQQEQQPLDMQISVSSLAEAYYAHQSAKELAGSGAAGNDFNRQQDDFNALDDIIGDNSGSSLDYVITQMDIARMTRNAARHLDVQSILTLPTITYRSKQKLTGIDEKDSERHAPEQQQQQENREEQPDLSISKECWSWIEVSSTNINSNSAADTTVTDDNKTDAGHDDHDVCVICLEHFVDGDRLRVLPCNHSFHTGCIDRWLSGSQSFEECYTSGCPTCKKRPDVIGNIFDPTQYNNNEQGNRSLSQTSSSPSDLPSWAFTQIGNALEKESGSIAL